MPRIKSVAVKSTSDKPKANRVSNPKGLDVPGVANSARLKVRPNSERQQNRQLATGPDPHLLQSHIPLRGTKEARERQNAKDDEAPFLCMEKVIDVMVSKMDNAFKATMKGKDPTKEQLDKHLAVIANEIKFVLEHSGMVPRPDAMLTLAEQLMTPYGMAYKSQWYSWIEPIFVAQMNAKVGIAMKFSETKTPEHGGPSPGGDWHPGCDE